MTLYSDAIEYFGYIDQVERCGELQMRMQSILVRPYVLECLNRFEQQHLEEEQKIKAKQNPTTKFFEKKRTIKGIEANSDSDSNEEIKSDKGDTSDSSTDSDEDV